MSDHPRVVELLPPPRVIADRLGDALREVKILRGLLRLAEQAEHWRRLDARSSDLPQRGELGDD
jgi:hypothetical protein